MTAHYDYILLGAGAAGLSLAYHLVQAGLGHKRILLLERAPKLHNDRTWCFWESQPGPFEPLVFRRWQNLWFYGRSPRRLEIAPYSYKMIRGADFYAYMQGWLAQQPNLELRYAEVTGLEASGKVWLGSEAVQGEWVFSSLYTPPPPNPRYHALLQHFMGWVVRAKGPVFDPGAATFMDFRVPQEGAVRFVYVLPHDAQTALVEYTVFSPQALPPAAYEVGLRNYLGQHLGLGEGEYQIQEVELGAIPMSDAPLGQREGCIVPIGLAAGRAKASTGYAFRRILRHSAAIAQALAKGQAPPSPSSGRHAWMDSVFLQALHQQGGEGWQVFEDLFAHNPPQRVLRFLDEQTPWPQDLQIMSSVDVPAFVEATQKVLRKRLSPHPQSQPKKV